jgi:protein phosphatase
VGATVWGAYAYAQSRAYLIDQGGYVAVYRGIPGTFAGLGLSWRVEVTDVAVQRLDPPQRTRLQSGIEFGALRDALARVADLRAESQPASATAAPAITATSTPTP